MSAYNGDPPAGQSLITDMFQFWGAPVYSDASGKLSCPGFSGETYDRNPWSYLVVNGKKTPGICEVAIDKGRDLDKKKGAGTDGETLTWHGLRLAEVQIQILIWTPDQLRALEQLWVELFPLAAKGDPKSFDVTYPSLGMHGVRSLAFYGGTGPMLGGPTPRSRVFVIHAVEFRKKVKKKATKTEKKSTGSALDPKAEVNTPGKNPGNTGP